MPTMAITLENNDSTGIDITTGHRMYSGAVVFSRISGARWKSNTTTSTKNTTSIVPKAARCISTKVFKNTVAGISPTKANNFAFQPLLAQRGEGFCFFAQLARVMH